MPILSVEIIGDMPESVRTGLAQRIADAAGRELKSRPQSTWVKLRYISAELYAENGGGPPDGHFPVLVSLLQAEPPTAVSLPDLVQRLSRVIGKVCKRPPESVHILLEPPAAGRMAFGGKMDP